MKLTPVEREVLPCLLTGGDNIAKNIADEIDRHPNSVRRSLKKLIDKNLVRDKGGGVHTLTLSGIATAQELLNQQEDN